jgi:transposase
VFFQDEARFGRIDNIASCWVPRGNRAKVGSQIIREYTYVYGAFCPETGESFCLILPYANTEAMMLYLNEFSEKFKDYRVIMAMDGASWHRSKNIEMGDNIVPLFQPPHSPELNPAECIWHHIREKHRFKNATFTSMAMVEERLCKALVDLQNDVKTIKSITGFDWILEAL